MPMLTERQLWSVATGLDAGLFGKNVIFHQTVASTNDEARRLAGQHAPEGTIVVAEEQTAGRGRLGRSWQSPPGVSLMQSILFRPRLEPALTNRLVMVAGLAAADACEQVAGVQVDVKWPNDLQIGGRKLAGILPESALLGDRLAWVIVGIGLNVSQRFAGDDPLAATATSLRQASGHEIDRLALWREMLLRLHAWYARLDDPALDAAWAARCITLGQRVRVQVGEIVREGVAHHLDEAGALWLQTPDGDQHRIVAGEATLI